MGRTGTDKGDRWRWALAFFVATYLLTGLLWFPVLRTHAPLFAPGRQQLLLLVASVAPSLMAIVMAAIEGGRASVRELLAQAGRWRFGAGWYALAILVMPVVNLVTLAGGTGLGAHASFAGLPLQILVPVSAIGEEFGWRGYALPRLQERIGALPAGLVIGVVWAAWHLPYFAYPSVHPLPFGIDFSTFTAVMVAESVLATWIYNSTGGSVLATILFHEGIHLAGLVPQVAGVTGALVMAAFALVAAVIAVVASGGTLTGFGRRNRLARLEPEANPQGSDAVPGRPGVVNGGS